MVQTAKAGPVKAGLQVRRLTPQDLAAVTAIDAGLGGRTRPAFHDRRLVAAQRNVAKETGVAFFNTFEAMGGEGSMAKWMRTGLGGGDLTHPTPQGAETIGSLFYDSLTTGFEAWLSRHPEALAAAP